MIRRNPGRLRGLAALVVLVVLLVGPPIALARFVGWPLPRALPGLDEVVTSTRSGIDDQVVVNALAVLAWLVWVQIAVAAGVELAALARGRVARRAPVLAGLQFGVGRLVAACALVAGSVAVRAVPAQVERLAPFVTQPVLPTPAAPVLAQLQLVSSPAEQPAPPGAAPSYVAIRNDSWWAIAEQVLGDGERWKELRSANVGRTMPDGTLIGPSTEDVRFGWPLLVPGAGDLGTASTGVPQPAEIVVQRGDNLWSITEHVLATEDGHQPAEAAVRERWAEVIELNRDRLADPADPDVIYAGQVLRVARETATPVPIGRPTLGSDPTATGGDPGAPALPAAESVAPTPPEPAPPPATVAVPATMPEAVPAALPGGQAPEAPRSGRTAAHGDADKRTEAPIGLLGTAGTMVAVGVAAALARFRRRRQLQLPPRAMAPPPPDKFDDLRSELCLRADTDHADRLHRAMRDVASALAYARSDARPRLVQVSPGRVEVVLSRPVVPAPPGWRAEASGSAWALSGEPCDTIPDGPAPAPALVSIGRPDATTEVYLDLEAEGVVAITGDEVLVADVARSWVLELATSPLAAGVSMVIVGDRLAPPPDTARVRVVPTWAEAAGDVRAWVEQSAALLAANRWPSPFSGRVGAHNDSLAPLVVIAERPQDDAFDALCAKVLESQVAAVIVSIGGEVEGATRITVGADGLSIPSLGLSCEAQAVPEQAARQVEALLEDASRPDVQLSFLPEPTSSPPVALGTAGDEYHDPPFEVLVRLLGEIEVVGGARKLRPQQTAVVAYIALNGPVAADRIEDAVWSAPTASRRKRLANTISACRNALGPDHLPLADADGRYATGPRLVTDLELFRRRIAYAPGQTAEAASATLRGALELVTGPVFTSRQAERSSFVWVDVENWISTWELAVTDAAEDLAGRFLNLHDLDGAVWAARRGLDACKTHSRLTKLLMEAHLARGEAEAARRVFESHQAALEKLELDDLAADLVDVYQAARGDRS